MTTHTTRGRVLVVEDEAYVRDSLVEILRARRFEVSAAASVDEALERVARSPLDVVLSDLKMPKKDGLELVRRIQATQQTVAALAESYFRIPRRTVPYEEVQRQLTEWDRPSLPE